MVCNVNKIIVMDARYRKQGEILNTNPLEDIGNTQDIKYIVKRGIVVQ
ncbi:hypothetical protein ZORO111903_13555 [Zobellia roscoffensis]